jgi:hypothetical protein
VTFLEATLRCIDMHGTRMCIDTPMYFDRVFDRARMSYITCHSILNTGTRVLFLADNLFVRVTCAPRAFSCATVPLSAFVPCCIPSRQQYLPMILSG